MSSSQLTFTSALYDLEIEASANIAKGNLTPLFDNQFGFIPSVLSGSYLEY